jgi:ankyrin repeat protein
MTISIDQLMRYVTIVLDLVHCQEWTKLERVTSEHKLFKVISEHIQKCDEFNGMTLLHAVIKYNPPLHILDAMIHAHDDAVKGQDCLGRTPLHVACGTGADVQLIRRLVKAFPQACDIPDEDGRLPLHFACDVECVLFDGYQAPRAPPSIDVVKALLSGSMQSVLVEDEDDMSPIEYAIVSDANIKVVKLLQKASMSLRRKGSDTIKAKAAVTSSTEDVKPTTTLPRSVLGYC